MNPEDLDLPQPPEGILDPQLPWSYVRPQSPLWIILKARLTGRPTEQGHYHSYVNISEADADRLIENLKKDPRGYPSVDQTSGNPNQWMEREQKYEKWLVEAYLENPFREEVNQKIEDAEIERRINEIQEQRKTEDKPEPQKEDEQVNEEQEQEVIDDLIDDVEASEPEVEQEPLPEEKEEHPKEQKPEEESNSKDIESIKESLNNIKGSISTQVGIIDKTNTTNGFILGNVTSIKDIFAAQLNKSREALEKQKEKSTESALEQQGISGESAKAQSTMGAGEAEGIIQNVTGDTLTIQTTKGEFAEGAKISQASSDGGLFGILKIGRAHV